ncbi:hypothetical protein V2E29_26410 [Streptomyces diastatochromogenes]|uniref:hypothetical protein n=1 Tax=Streptomyces diastatochromogenes TaxID=42236 RepID=UPI002F26DCBB
MLRIIRTPRLAELDNLASAFPLVRSKCDGLEKELDAARRHAQGLERELAQAKTKFQKEQAATARTHEERLAAAGRSARLNEHMLDEAQERANRIERLADEKVRDLKAEIDRLKTKLATNPVPNPEGVVARFQNLVGAPIDLTLYVKDLGSGYPQAEMQLVLLCAGCGYTEDKTWQGADRPEYRMEFIDHKFQGGALKRWAQEHAEKCRAVALPALVTA